MSQTAHPLAVEPMQRALAQHLFAQPELQTYAVLDGAAIPDLLPKLGELAPEQVCLYRGELEPDMAECAPYLVRLERDSPFTRWVLEQGWGNHWGIFVLTAADFDALRRHFRTFLIVLSPEGKRLYFRYYDPRVLRVYLPTCNEEETKHIFGAINQYICEDANPERALTFSVESGLPRRAILPGAIPTAGVNQP